MANNLRVYVGKASVIVSSEFGVFTLPLDWLEEEETMQTTEGERVLVGS